MKRLKFLPVVLMLFACNNVTDRVVDEVISVRDPIEVTFNVKNLGVSVEDIDPPKLKSQNSSSLGEAVSSISYYIYDKNNKYVTSGTSKFEPGVDPVPDNFGRFNIKLIPDVYNVIFYAQGKGNGSFIANNFDEKFYYDSFFRVLNKEIFYWNKELSVSTTDSGFDLSLPRISGLLRINITDNLIPEVKKVTVSIREYNKWFPGITGVNSLQSADVRTFAATLGDDKMEIFDHYVVRPQNVIVTIKVLGDSDLLLGEKQLTVPIYENRKTIISGELFSLIGSKDFTITVSEEWGEDHNVPL